VLSGEIMKTYQISFSVSVKDATQSYPEVYPLNISIKENLPINVDVQKYLRKRISEELTRNFQQLSEADIQNKTEEFISATDSLEGN
jgi:hypothetical protein